MTSTTENLLKKIIEASEYSEKDLNLIQKAFKFAEDAHRGQKRVSGEEYVTHPLSAALLLSELGLDGSTIAACLLHDTLEDTSLTKAALEKEFGKEIAFLVDGVTKLGKIQYAEHKDDRAHTQNVNSLKKMFFAMAEDIRVILIKLADRCHNMETLRYLPKENQRRIAQETLEIYAPIAARLGMGRLKGQLEDLAFPYVFPEEHQWLLQASKENYGTRLKYIEKTKHILNRKLKDAGIEVLDLHSRAKHYYSLYQKVLRREMDISKIFDLVAMRVILPDVKSCYEALGVIHKFYKPISGLIKDYIAVPKPNGYKSIHTTIFYEKGRIVEIQLRTPEMHDFAENGIAAHWAYSESGKKKPITASIKDAQWVSQLKSNLKDMSNGEDFSHLKIDFFKNRIFVFTPKGDVKDLPESATPIDFAYAIHTDLGNTIMGAMVNGKLVGLDYELKNGDIVEVVKQKNAKPSLDWLNIVRTTEAKKRIRGWLRSHVPSSEFERGIIEKIPEAVIKKPIVKPATIRKKGTPASKSKIRIGGHDDLMYKLARCCNPTSQKQVCGYLTKTKGVTIHLTSCSNIKGATKDRLLDVNWT